MTEGYESYFEMDVETKEMCQHLLLHKYLESNDTDVAVYAAMQINLQKYEKAEMYSMCQLYKDAIKLLFDEYDH